MKTYPGLHRFLERRIAHVVCNVLPSCYGALEARAREPVRDVFKDGERLHEERPGDERLVESSDASLYSCHILVVLILDLNTVRDAHNRGCKGAINGASGA